MCTGIQIDYDNGSVMGRTMDYEIPLEYNILYFPRAYNYAEDLRGNKLYSKYRALGICFEDHNQLKDGVNEHGLVGITNMFTGFNLYSRKLDENKFNISSFEYFNYALMNYKNVDELLEDLDNIHISTRDLEGREVICPDFHFMFTDSSQRCVVIEPKKGSLISYENPYKTMTNSPNFDSHVKRLRKHIDLDDLESFNSSKDLPGGYDPVSRFIKAFYLNKANVESKDYREALSTCYNILDSMSLPNGFIENKKYQSTTYTRYICAYDTENKLLTVKSDRNPKVYHLGFDDIENLEEKKSFYLNKNFTTEKLK